MGILLSAWNYRYFILSSIKVDFRGRFVRSRLGAFWAIVHPLVLAATFAIVLSQVLAARLPEMADNKMAYGIYLLAGTLAWSLFTEVISRCLTVFIENGNLLKKIVFPRICLPLIVTGSALINNLLLLGAIFLILTLMGYFPGSHVFWLPLLMVVTLALSLGLGLSLGTLNVFIRDIGQIVPVILQLGFWFTPIVYSVNILPESLRFWLQLNPMYWIVKGYQNALLFNKPPDWIPLGCVILLSLLSLRTALFLFRKASSEMVDVL